MSGPAPGKSKINITAYIHEKGKSQARITHIDLESEEISNGERFRIGCASARGAHISKEKLVDEMIKCGLRLGREKGYEQAVIEQYLETRVQLLSDGYGLKEQTATQLKARIYQGKLEFVS